MKRARENFSKKMMWPLNTVCGFINGGSSVGS